MFELNNYLSGSEYNAHKFFGFHFENGKSIFRVYAPNANKVYLAASFNYWQGDLMEMTLPGVYEITYDRNLENELYKFKICSNDGEVLKSDPYAFKSELRPNTASVCYIPKPFNWNKVEIVDQPINIYEIHLNSWPTNNNYVDIANSLAKYLNDHNFTHVEVMPINEYPFDKSWGYQLTGYFSITTRYGSPEEFKQFVQIMHDHHIKVIIDWVPTHFVKDSHGLGKFDGSHLFESDKWYAREIEEWDTYLFDFSRGYVQSFLISSAMYLIEEYNIDGLRIDAVNYMIYYKGRRDYGENYSAIEFMKKLNAEIKHRYPHVITIAEDSSTYANVTNSNGLNFDYKWNFGWMHDTLKFFGLSYEDRRHQANMFTFAAVYFNHENYVLMLSHDEVVHEKGSIINKIYGSYEEKFMQLKTLYLYMYTFPGIKGNFMGNELASFDEFDESKDLHMDILNFYYHNSFNHFFKKLCKFYLENEILCSNEFEWVHIHNDDSVFAYLRKDLVVILNLSNNDYFNYGINCSGEYQVEFNTYYNNESQTFYNSIDNKVLIDLPKLSGVILRRK